MSLKTAIDLVFEELVAAKERPLRKDSFADWFCHDARLVVEEILQRPDLVVDASAGKGNWAEVPWIGVFNPENTTSATTGIYVVYLFAPDAKRVFLCQGQGVTRVREEFGKDKDAELQRRAALMRARVPEYKEFFANGPIDLGGTTTLAKDYDGAVAYFREYRQNELPDDADLHNDLKRMVGLYDLLIARGGTDNIETAVDLGSVGKDSTIDEKRRYVRHRKIERNSTVSKKVKAKRGFRCEACHMVFQPIYGERGKDYIEAHHLTPLASLSEGTVVTMNPDIDFAVLCSNCHSIVHRGNQVMTMEELIALPGIRQLRAVFDKLISDIASSVSVG